MEVEQVIHGLILSCMLNCPQTRYWTPNCLLLNLETSQGAFDLALCITPDEQVGTLPVPFTINVNGECDKCHKAQKYRKALYECRCIYYLLSKVTQLLKSAKHQRIFPQETSFSGLCSFLKEFFCQLCWTVHHRFCYITNTSVIDEPISADHCLITDHSLILSGSIEFFFLMQSIDLEKTDHKRCNCKQ